jgi:hypothetical protein
MMKFNSCESYKGFYNEISDIYLGEDSGEINPEDDLNSSFVPKIIDSRANELSEIKSPVLAKKEKSNEYNAKILESMPRSNYTTDIDQKSINLTCTVENTGVKEWPSAFMVYIISTSFDSQKIDMHKLIQYNPVVDKKINPGNVLKLDVMLLNPNMIGTFNYVLSMHTLDFVPFGEPFEFEFTIKDTVKSGWANRHHARPG